MAKTSDLLGRAWQLHEAGKLDAAEKKYRRYLKENPQHVEALNLLGLLLLQKGRSDQAILLIGRALKLTPEDLQAQYNMGLALVRESAHDKAVHHFLKASGQGDIEAVNALGNALRLTGQVTAAMAHLEPVYLQYPDHLGAATNFAHCLLDRGRHEQGAALYREVLSKDGAFTEALIGLSRLLIETDAFEDVEALLGARTIHNHPALLNNLGVALNRLGSYETAEACFNKALQQGRNEISAMTNLGVLYEQRGATKDAERVLRAAVKAQPHHGPAQFHLSQLASLDNQEQLIDSLEALLGAQRRTTDDNRVYLLHALARHADRCALYKKAFAALFEAHELQKNSSHYDPVVDSKIVDQIVAVNTKSPIEDSASMVFVVGMPRSGTTLTDQILDSHSALVSLGETSIIPQAALSMSQKTGQPFPNCMVAASATDWLEVHAEAEASYSARTGPSSSSITVDTTPTNYLRTGLIKGLFPRARVIICQRDPLDTCLSIYQQKLSASHGYAHDLQWLASRYQDFSRLCQRWNDDGVYSLCYEQLVTAPEQEIDKLFAFLQLTTEPACVSFYENDRYIRTPSASQVRRRLYTDSIGRWRNYEEALQPLIRSLA